MIVEHMMVDHHMVGISLFMISQHLMVNNYVVGIRHSPCTPDFIPADFSFSCNVTQSQMKEISGH
jgi:hypothetical protein